MPNHFLTNSHTHDVLQAPQELCRIEHHSGTDGSIWESIKPLIHQLFLCFFLFYWAVIFKRHELLCGSVFLTADIREGSELGGFIPFCTTRNVSRGLGGIVFLLGIQLEHLCSSRFRFLLQFSAHPITTHFLTPLLLWNFTFSHSSNFIFFLLLSRAYLNFSLHKKNKPISIVHVIWVL